MIIGGDKDNSVPIQCDNWHREIIIVRIAMTEPSPRAAAPCEHLTEIGYQRDELTILVCRRGDANKFHTPQYGSVA